jgi:hypothetical protein
MSEKAYEFGYEVSDIAPGEVTNEDLCIGVGIKPGI